MMIINIKEWIHNTSKKLSLCDNSRYEAELLLMHVSTQTRSSILISNYIRLNELQFKYLSDLVTRRSKGEPIAYLIGEKEFWSLSLRVSYDTLIPRPDTEILVEQSLLKITDKHASILDLGTGCGAIALALASECSTWNITGIDHSKKALKIAQYNALTLNLFNVSFFYSNWFSHINRKFNIIVSNPPYVGINEVHMLKKNIFFEPMNAIFSPKDGFSDIKFIIQHAHNYLWSGGWLLIEHGWKQKSKIQYLFYKYNFQSVQSYKDYGGNYRVTVGKKIHI